MKSILRIGFLAAVTTIMIFTFSCGENEDSQSCNTDSDCKGDRICENNNCVDPYGCESDSDCKDDRICEDNNCVDPNGCESDSDCKGDRICENNVCIKPYGNGDEDEDNNLRNDGDLEDDSSENGDMDEETESAEEDDDVVESDSSEDGDMDEETESAEEDDEPDGDVGDDCEVDEECMENLSCDDFTFKCAEQTCKTAADCVDDTSTTEMTCGEDFLCYAKPCLNSVDDCSTGFACLGGVCKIAPSCNTADSIVINEGSGLITEGAVLTLSATVFNVNGAKLELPPDFTWTATSTGDTVTVDANGKITGGATDGNATIEVTLNCKSSVTSDVTYTNFAAVTSGVRVVAFDMKTGELLPDGGKAYIDDGSKVAVEADIIGGIAAFASADCAGGCAVHVLHSDYTYVSAFGLTTNDILIPVDRNVDADVATGVKGTVDYTRIPDVFQELNVHLALALFSIPGSLMDLKFENMIGEKEEIHLDLGSVFNDYVDLPTGLELYLENERITPEQYRAQGIPGPATLWALGGFADLNEFLELVTGALDGDEFDILNILVAVIPLFESFYHGIVPGFDLPALPKDDDSADYASFEDIGTDLILSQAQTQNAEIVVPALPVLPGDDGCQNLVLSIVGAMQTGVGFIPLGLGSSHDLRNDTDTANCLVGTNNDGIFSQAFAPQHSGISGYPYYGIAITMNADNTIIDPSVGKGTNFAASIYRSIDGSPTTVTYPDFIGFLDAAWNKGTHTMTATDVDGAAFHRVVFSIADAAGQRYHHIYWASGGFTLTLPSGAEDRTVGATGLGQAASMGAVSYDDLFGFNGTNINQMNDFIESFSNCELK